MSFTTCIIWFFLAISGFNQLKSSHNEPKFELKYQDWVTDWIGDLTQKRLDGMTEDQKYPMELTMGERIDLCNAAKKFAGPSIDVLSPITEVPLFSYYVFRLVMQCDTLPVAYLEVDDKPANNKWKIVINTNDMAKTHNFEVEKRIVEPIPSSATYIDVAEPELDDLVHSFKNLRVAKGDSFSNFSSNDRLLLCLAAKLEIIRGDHVPPHQVPVMLSKEVDSPQAYDFGNAVQMALKCPCAPPMYIYFKEPSSDKKNVQVVLVGGGREPQPMTMTLS